MANITDLKNEKGCQLLQPEVNPSSENITMKRACDGFGKVLHPAKRIKNDVNEYSGVAKQQIIDESKLRRRCGGDSGEDLQPSFIQTSTRPTNAEEMPSTTLVTTNQTFLNGSLMTELSPLWDDMCRSREKYYESGDIRTFCWYNQLKKRFTVKLTESSKPGMYDKISKFVDLELRVKQKFK